MTSELDILVEVPPEDMMGKAMLALNERQRRFVCAMAVTGGDQKEAYRWAGYEVTNDNSAQASASRMAGRPDVEEAMKEEALRRLKGSAIIAVSTLVQIAGPRSTSKDKDKIAASVALLDRIKGFAGKTEHTQTIVHALDEKTAGELIDFIRRTALDNNLDPVKLLGGSIIDTTCDEVLNVPEDFVDPDLADLL